MVGASAGRTLARRLRGAAREGDRQRALGTVRASAERAPPDHVLLPRIRWTGATVRAQRAASRPTTRRPGLDRDDHRARASAGFSVHARHGSTPALGPY